MSRFMLSAPISRLLLGFFYAATFLTSLPAARGIQFEFEAEEGTSQAVIDAFTEAGQMWADRLADNITIRLSIGFSQLDPDVIGQTSIGYYFVEAPPGDPPVLAPSYTELQAALAARATSVDDFSAVNHLPSGLTYSRLINHTLENGNSSATYVDTMDWVGVT